MDAGKAGSVYQLCLKPYTSLNPTIRTSKPLQRNWVHRKNSWKYVWQLYATAPKYPEIETLLRLAKPADLGSGGVCPARRKLASGRHEQKEEVLAQALTKVAKQDTTKPLISLPELENGTRCKKKLGVV